MKKFCVTLLGLVAATLPVSAANILSPADTIVGGILNGSTFEVGAPTGVGGTNSWPAAEPPTDLINGVMGGGAEKYLNFAKFNTGVIITPLSGKSVISDLTLFVANDAVERDPADYQIYGTNVNGSLTLSDYTLIWEDALALPDARDTVPDEIGNSQNVTFPNSAAFTSYMLIFPTVKNGATANSMQISELQINGVLVPEPSVLGLLAGALGLGLRRRRV